MIASQKSSYYILKSFEKDFFEVGVPLKIFPRLKLYLSCIIIIIHMDLLHDLDKSMISS